MSDNGHYQTVTDKKLEWKRIIIFCLFAYGIAWVFWIGLFSKYGEFAEWASNPRLSFLALMLMFPPAIANVLTRLITKEGWGGSYLHLHIKGNIKYYLAGAFVPLLYGLISGFVASFVFGDGFSMKAMLEASGGAAGMIGILLTGVSRSSAIAFYTFGEEFGWRAYLYPKLEKLIGTPGAVVVGGIIWGLWHVPLTIQGHNFGTDYWGYPWLGILLMVIYCIFVGAFLMWMTKKTGSVYPASIAHSVNNNCVFTSILLVAPVVVEKAETINMLNLHAVHMSITCAVGLVFFILLTAQKKKLS